MKCNHTSELQLYMTGVITGVITVASDEASFSLKLDTASVGKLQLHVLKHLGCF